MLRITNNATSTLAANIITTDVSIPLATGDGSKFPTLGAGDWFPATIVDASANIEVVKVTGRSGDTLTVSRGQEGTTARSFVAGSRIDLRLTAAAIASIQTDITNLQTLAATLAPLEDAELTGAPTAPTPTAGDDSTAIATTDFVVNAIAAGVSSGGNTVSGIPSSSVVFTLKQTAPTGWLLFLDQTIGDASSGATYANADAEIVFTDMYPFQDADCPVFNSAGVPTTRSALGSAAAAWAAHARISLPKTLGRALASAGNGNAGATLSARAPGNAIGEETHVLTEAELASHTHVVDETPHSHDIPSAPDSVTPGLVRLAQTSGTTLAGVTPTDTASTGITLENTGGGSAHNNMPPTIFLNAMVKK